MEKIETLKKHLEELASIPDEKWIQGLEYRKIKELEFHDQSRDKERVASLDSATFNKFFSNRRFYSTDRNRKFYSTSNGMSDAYVDSWIRLQAKDKVFLDYACGNGKLAIMAGQTGATLSVGLDISPVSIQNAKENSIKLGVEKKTFFFQGDAENTMLPDNSMDVILCSGLLHHLDLSYAYPELRRILAPGGRILAIEALSYNPIIKMYRHLTPFMRTEWEKSHILNLRDVQFASRFFDIGEIRYWHIFSILGAYFSPLLPAFNAIDFVLTKIPLVKLMAWSFTFELISRK